jgi:hypothetical protein
MEMEMEMKMDVDVNVDMDNTYAYVCCFEYHSGKRRGVHGGGGGGGGGGCWVKMGGMGEVKFEVKPRAFSKAEGQVRLKGVSSMVIAAT